MIEVIVSLGAVCGLGMGHFIPEEVESGLRYFKVTSLVSFATLSIYLMIIHNSYWWLILLLLGSFMAFDNELNHAGLSGIFIGVFQQDVFILSIGSFIMLLMFGIVTYHYKKGWKDKIIYLATGIFCFITAYHLSRLIFNI